MSRAITPNKIIMNNDTLLIVLKSKKYGDKECVIDIEDYNKIKIYRWGVYKNKKRSNFYCIARDKDKKRTTIKIHRLLLSVKKGKEVDHINRNGLDNRKCNLRICNTSENCCNREYSRKSNCNFKGVYYNKRFDRYIANIKKEQRQIYLGCFKTPEEAHQAYCAASKKYHGKFGRAK